MVPVLLVVTQKMDGAETHHCVHDTYYGLFLFSCLNIV